MRICLIHQYFKTPETGGAIRSYYIADYLVQQGHKVTVITARNNKAYSIDDSHGYDVHYIPVYYENHLSFLSRLHAFFIFVWKANQLIKKLQPFDLNYVITTPLTTGFIANKSLKRFGTPYIFEVGDLWPEAPIQLGVIKNPFLKWLTRKWEKSFYTKAKAIVALSPDIKIYIQKLVPNKPIEVITNFSDAELFRLSDSSTDYDWKDKFVISYLGTAGMANQLEYMIDCADNLRNDERIHFVIVGSGAKYSSVKEYAFKKGLRNISFFGHMDKSKVASILQVTDAVYVSFKNVPVLSSGSPNKLFDGLACGKLIIINFEGWIKELIEKNNCGVYHNPEKPGELIKKLDPYLNESVLNKAKANSLHLSKMFSPKNQLKKLDILLES